MNKKLVLLVIMLFTASPLWAEGQRIMVIADTPIAMPVPEGFKDASKEKDAPENQAYFTKAEPEAWEQTGEIYDYILAYGVGLKPSSEAIKQQKFETIANIVKSRIEAWINARNGDEASADTPPAASQTLVSEEILAIVMRNSSGSRAYHLETTENSKFRKAFLIDTSFEMPGVFTFPILEEISFIRVQDRIIITHAKALDISKLNDDKLPEIDARARVKAASAEIRDGLLAKN